jgi:spore coat polysaccharide biosynthesis predicted glycosyltransferase SpsG
MIKLGIRVANSIVSGRGHFERCFSISNYFSNKVLWFLDEKNEFYETRIKDKDEIIYEEEVSKVSAMVKAINEDKINIILLDSYNIDINSISKSFKNIPLCVFQDTDKLLKAHMIICPHPIEINKNKGAIILCGPSFAPISSKFIYNKSVKKDHNINLLISMGAYDSAGITLNIIKSIKKLSEKIEEKINIKIVLGKGSPTINKINNLIKNDSNYDLLVNVNDMTEIYNNSSIAIGAPGLSHMERLYFGIPTILIAQNNIHESIIDKWVNIGCALKSVNTISMIEKKLLYIIENRNIRNNLIQNGRNLVDGKGALRIAKAMLKIV